MGWLYRVWEIASWPIRFWWRTFCAEALKEAAPVPTVPEVKPESAQLRETPAEKKPRARQKKPFHPRKSQSDIAANWELRQSTAFKRAQEERARRKEAQDHGNDHKKR